ncbi:FkbM family methyltransferase [Opitutaceae bacterium]|nr:FkbM family methyltransferase [Opitutaceae bacterium]MDB4474189.1 FkbM family methyltransferase [Opitutaceae bacterium]
MADSWEGILQDSKLQDIVLGLESIWLRAAKLPGFRNRALQLISPNSSTDESPVSIEEIEGLLHELVQDSGDRTRLAWGLVSAQDLLTFCGETFNSLPANATVSSAGKRLRDDFRTLRQEWDELLINYATARPGFLRLMLNRPAVQTELVNDAGIMKRLLNRPEVVAQVAGNESLWRRLATDEKSSRVVLKQEGLSRLLQRAGGEEETRELIYAALLQDPGDWKKRVVASFVENEDVRREIVAQLGNEELQTELVNDAGIMKRLLNRPEVVAQVAGNESLWRRLATDEKSSRVVLQQEGLSRLLQRAGGEKETRELIYAALLQDPGDWKKRVVASFVENEDVRREIVAQLGNKELQTELVNDAGIMKRLLNRPEVVAQVVERLLPKLMSSDRCLPQMVAAAMSSPAFLQVLLDSQNLGHHLRSHRSRKYSKQLMTMIPRSIELDRLSKGLKPWIELGVFNATSGQSLEAEVLASSDNLWQYVVNRITEGDYLRLRHGRLKLPDLRCVRILMNELFLEEVYRHLPRSKQVKILDLGAHVGLTEYYLLERFPHAKIVAVEADEHNFALLRENHKQFGWSQVKLVNAAVTGHAGDVQFYPNSIDSMAGHVGSESDADSSAKKIKSVTLSSLLTGPVSLLKIDIEGAEREVLLEARNQLPLAETIICEFHFKHPTSGEELAEILSLLVEKKFTYYVESAYSSTKSILAAQPDHFVRHSLTIRAFNLNA